MRNSWGSAESRLNQVGTLLVVIPPVLAAMVLTGRIPITVPVVILFGVAIISGLVGGAINLVGRGPVIIGALVGLVIALGGFVAVYGWSQLRGNLYSLEVPLVFIVGTAPGFLLQRLLQGVVQRHNVRTE